MESSSLKYCSVLLDSARLTEKHSFYFDLLPYLAKWGYNTILWHFTDDQGCSLRFDTRPELASQGAFSKEEMKSFISCARRKGIEVIPELESFGHAGYITRRMEYRHLFETIEGRPFGAVCPSSPETIEILEDLIREVAELFPSEHIHAGCDEVSFGSCPRCRERLSQEKPWEVFAQHIETIRLIMGKYGKKMMMWGDHLTSEPELANRIPKDITICDWQYFDVEASNVSGLLEKGFDVVCCPALMNAGKVIHPRESNLENIKEFTRVASNSESARVVGMMNTVWCPYRYLQGAVIHGIALGAAVFRNADLEPEHFSREFAADYFAVADAAAVGNAIRAFYGVAPELSLVKSLAPLDWDEFEPPDTMQIEECERMRREGLEILATLQAHRPHIHRNINHYDDILVSAETIVGLADNAADIRRFFEIVSMDDLREGNTVKPRAQDLLRSLAARSRSLHARVRECWKKTRFEDDPKRDGRTTIYPHDSSLAHRLKSAADFFVKLT